MNTPTPAPAIRDSSSDPPDDDSSPDDLRFLRVTFVSNRVPAGVYPRIEQALARHEKIETTMGAYTDLTSLDLRGAIEMSGASSSGLRGAQAKGAWLLARGDVW